MLWISNGFYVSIREWRLEHSWIQTEDREIEEEDKWWIGLFQSISSECDNR